MNKYILRSNLTFFCCILLITSLIYSPFLLSVSMFGLVSVAVLQTNERGRLRLHTQLVPNFKKFLRQPEYLAVTLFFWVVFLSGWQTIDYDYWGERLRLKVPFLVLPFIFYQLRESLLVSWSLRVTSSLKEREQFYYRILYFLLLLLTVTCIGIGINYLLHFEEINAAIKQGRSIPTPRNHIRFSLILAIGITGSGYLYLKKYVYRYAWERRLILGCTIFLFLFIHVLSVRSGLLALYVALFALLVRFISIEKKYLVGMAGIIALTALPVVAYYTVPSFQKKISYAVWDLQMYQKGESANYSDAGRLVSLQIGWELAQRQPLVGVGAGNLRQEIKEIYRTQFPDLTEPKMPHNQWLSVFAGTGIVGLLIFGVGFFLPLFYEKNYQNPLFLGFYAIIFTSLMMENTLENSMGIGLYAFFLLLLLNYLQEKKTGKQSY
ncbi:MAG: O-antigen ligase family protein [Saprospiraceae bacterium]